MSEYRILDGINSPYDLKNTDENDLELLCSEIRDFLCKTVKNTGGHLASNLGVVELTVALHREFDFLHDHLIFDVGHQAYTHKIITGRKKEFPSLRKRGGLSGFTKRSESPYDCFGAGHSSTSVSAAIGFASADKLSGSDAYTVAVLGDGAFTGGMVHEALNNCRSDLKLIIILNENDMSISKNTGAFATLIAKIRASKKYYKTKRATAKIVQKLPLVGHFLFEAMKGVKQRLKNKIFKSNYFEDLGLYYLGPVDGHDCIKLQRLLNEAKNAEKSTVIHVRTVKGKGYAPAEKDPGRYHGISPDGTEKDENFSSFMGKTLSTLANENDKICAVTAAMATGTGLDHFSASHKDRFFDVGIAEEHALTFCAGLSANGYIPYFAVYSSFLQRGYDNVIHDIALQNLPVRIMIDRAGISASDGATHHGIFDVPFLMSVPNISLYAPCDFSSLEEIMKKTVSDNCPVAIRYANCSDTNVIEKRFKPMGEYVLCDADENAQYVVITYGKIVSEALAVCDGLRSSGIGCTVILLQKLKPYKESAEIIAPLLKEGIKKTVFLEEGIKNGGASMVISSYLNSLGIENIKVVAIDDAFESDKVTGNIYSDFGIGAETVLRELLK